MNSPSTDLKGFTGNFFIHTFGCQMNSHDSDRMAEVLQMQGWHPTDRRENADLIVLNTCSVREKAEQKLRSEVGTLGEFKEQNKNLIVVVAGCVAQQEGQNLLKRANAIDIVIGPDNILDLPNLVEDHLSNNKRLHRTVFDLEHPQFLQARPQPGQVPVSTYVTTMKGCDERCSFCIVPYTRGPERYRPAQQIIEEIQRLVDAGAREVTLLGQTVDSYRDASLPPPESDDPDESQFPSLLRLIARSVPGLLRLRYTSPHPRHATASLARAHAELEVLAHHVHMPVQSGSDRILKRMIRRYKRAEYVERVTRLKNSRPGLTLSTDIIVGFPGETDEDFAQTISLVKEVGFTSLFGFKYSVRPYAPSRKMADDVPDSVKRDRLAALFEVAEQQSQEHLRSLVGTTQLVLVEGPSKNEDAQTRARGTTQQVQGHSLQNEIVHFEIPKGVDAKGRIVKTTILQANKHSLKGIADEAETVHLPILSADAKVKVRLPVLGAVS